MAAAAANGNSPRRPVRTTAPPTIVTHGHTFAPALRSGMDSPPQRTVVVVSHTHWDREWYHPLGRMRQRLVTLIDQLLDAPDGLPFLLDGQAIVLDDYRAMRPERAEVLRAALQSSQLEAGPWYVLADMLIPGGEALVRNLLEGTRTVREAGGAPPRVLYSPDAFGHSAAGPVLAAGFGLDVAIVWRGFGGQSHPDKSVVHWTHPSGASVLLWHLPPDGYEVGSSLPTAPSDAQERWCLLESMLFDRNPLDVALLPNGADHHARQLQRGTAIASLADAAAPARVVVDSLAGFASRLVRAADRAELSSVRGELRDSGGWTWALQGTFSTRAHQKRMNAHVERAMVRQAEPWSALAWFAFGHETHALRTAWKTLLATHPHDTLCGCSADAVATASDARRADALAQAHGICDDAMHAVIGHDRAADRERMSAWRNTVVLCNSSARARGGVIAIRLFDAVTNDPVGPGSAAVRTSLDTAVGPRADAQLHTVQCSHEFDRVESPLHYPSNAVVSVRDTLAWIEPISGYAVTSVAATELSRVVRHVPDAARVQGDDVTLRGSQWRVEHSAHGIVGVHASGLSLDPVGWLESVTDAGDTYTPSPRGAPVLAPWSAPRATERGPLRATWAVSARLDRPRDSVAPATDLASHVAPESDIVTVSATASLSLVAGADRIDVRVVGENTAGDHRLRWVLKLPDGLRTDRVLADAAFGAVERVMESSDARAWPAEQRLNTAPLHRWLWFSGEKHSFGFISDGLAEYELLPDGHLAVTLLRAVGELSRRDLPERVGHAGWPTATPLAQSRGPFEARFSLVALPADRDAAIAQIEQTSDDVLLPLTGETWRGVAAPSADFAGLTLDGEGLSFSAAKRSEDGRWLVLRCINQRATAVHGSWRLPRVITEARLARLDETPGAAIAVSGAQLAFDAPPLAIVTILVC